MWNHTNNSQHVEAPHGHKHTAIILLQFLVVSYREVIRFSVIQVSVLQQHRFKSSSTDSVTRSFSEQLACAAGVYCHHLSGPLLSTVRKNYFTLWRSFTSFIKIDGVWQIGRGSGQHPIRPQWDRQAAFQPQGDKDTNKILTEGFCYSANLATDPVSVSPASSLACSASRLRLSSQMGEGNEFSNLSRNVE